MDQTSFEEAMRRMLYHKPFIPFEVEKVDGTIVVVDQQFAMGGGMAAYITPEAGFVEIRCEEVKAIRPLTHEAAR